ncbi:hypothetical protein GCM10009827_038350 [Dactylosporangium maewongense]|uniref:Uncharacterized protein n=1 Tax=Dactylosporangium maewongense TaxID=634393 RepID=A0ABN2AHF3_9ACTN
MDDASAALDGPPTPHRLRANNDAVAVLLLRCAGSGRSFWHWTEQEWTAILGEEQQGFRAAAPDRADDAVRPPFGFTAFLPGGFTAFHRLGSFSRLVLAWRAFGRDRVDSEIRRIRAVLAERGYRPGRDEDKLLPMVTCQVFLLNRSTHIDALSTGLCGRIRCEQLPVAHRECDGSPFRCSLARVAAPARGSTGPWVAARHVWGERRGRAVGRPGHGASAAWSQGVRAAGPGAAPRGGVGAAARRGRLNQQARTAPSRHAAAVRGP